MVVQSAFDSSGKPRDISAMPGRGRNGGTSQRILDIAERLMQVRGYNGFSYADVAESLHLTKASLHYHFPSKAELGRRLMERYTQNFLAALAAIDGTSTSARQKLERYVSIYSDVLANNRMCLCGMLAAEYATLPKSVKAEVTRFFDANEVWLAAVMQSGAQSEGLKLASPPAEAARLMIAALEGAMMLARSYGDAARFDRVGQHLLADIAGG
jgi:TetR/AcrR family transcriptional regulator, transcriptional repressor for nem operon